MSVQVLVVDDDKDLCGLLKKCLEKEGLKVEAVQTGGKCMALLDCMEEFQLVVLDVMLPEIDGFSLLSEIRRVSPVPVLMLTARGEEADRVRGLQHGADDYLSKPFSLQEFTARVIALIRRYTELNPHGQSLSDIYTAGNIQIDYGQHSILLEGHALDLTAKEFTLVAYLARNHNRVFTKEQIYEHVWGQAYAFDDANIMAFISRLRKKLSLADPTHQYIQTVRNVGYRFHRKE